MSHRIARQLAALEQLQAEAARPSTLTPEEQLFEQRSYDEMLAGFDRDPTMSVIPDDFMVYEPTSLRKVRVERLFATLDALNEGDPDERRETLAVLRTAFDDETATDFSMFVIE